jgi:hypothetical protein
VTAWFKYIPTSTYFVKMRQGLQSKQTWHLALSGTNKTGPFHIGEFGPDPGY